MKFFVSGMSCAACSARVEKAVSSVLGVTKCEVNLLTGTMNVDGNFSSQEICNAVQKAGYKAKLYETKTQTFSEQKLLLIRLVLSFILLVFLMLLKNAQIFFAVAIMLINSKFFVSGMKSLFHLSPNMDTLVALGSFASFIYKSYDGAAMILTFITIGKTLEAYAKGKTTNAIKSLLKLTPKTALVLKTDEKGAKTEVELPVEQVQTGDIFIVRPGQNIPVDGVVTEGFSSVNEASISGETIPVDKFVSAEVIAGTTNLNGILTCKATRVGSDTTIAQIIQFVNDSAASKAPVQKIADKVSAVFIPVVMGIAIITFFIWYLINKDFDYSLMRGISVLVVSCPCALGLATPVAVMVGNGVGAKKGILFKNSIALEQAGKAKFVVLDKTGTITKGNPVVTKIEGNSPSQVLAIAQALEKNSTHPIAKAICKFTDAKTADFSFQLKDFSEIAGKGVKAFDCITGDEYFCGKTANSNLICVTKNGRTIGKISIEDELKEDSSEAITKLQELGLKVVMLTGDSQTNADKTAKMLKTMPDKIFAGVLPNQKAEIIQKLKTQGIVIMVGDGINDAPALTVADVGVAIGAGSDIAIDSADVVLVKNSLMDIVNAILISRKILKNIKENLFWAFFYNICAIPIAAGVFSAWGITLTPAISSACMSLSSFCVVSNALRLNRIKK